MIVDGPILASAIHIETGRHARRVPVRVSSLDDSDEVAHDGVADELEQMSLAASPGEQASVPRSLPRVRRGVEGLKALISFGPRKAKTVLGYIHRWNSFEEFVEWCDQEHYDPWVFSPTVFELFAGWKYELNKTKSIDVYASSFNYIYRVHNLYPAFKDGRIREVKVQFRKAAQARRNDEGEEYLRTDMPSRAVLYALAQLEDHQREPFNKTNSERIVAILILLLFWVRGSTFGHSKPGDLRLVEGLGGPTLTFTLTRVKRGPQLYAPTTMGIPLVPPAGNRAAPLFKMVHRHIKRFPDFSGESLGLTFDNAADLMTDWIRLYMPRDRIVLPPGTFISSQSGRITGCTHARVSLECSFGVIQSWGGWITPERCKGYIRAALPDNYYKDMYWFICPGLAQPKNPHVTWPRVGMAQED